MSPADKRVFDPIITMQFLIKLRDCTQPNSKSKKNKCLSLSIESGDSRIKYDEGTINQTSSNDQIPVMQQRHVKVCNEKGLTF